MTKNTLFGIFILCSLLFLAGCAKERGENSLSSAFPGGEMGNTAEEAEILEEVKNPQLDNTLDRYTAIAKGSLRIAPDDRENGETSVTSHTCTIGKSRGVHYATHLYGTIGKCLYELHFADDEGENKSILFDTEPDLNGIIRYAERIGSIWESDDILLFMDIDIKGEPSEEGKFQLSFRRMDESLQEKDEIPLDGILREKVYEDGTMSWEVPSSCKQDAQGRIHFVTSRLTTNPDAEDFQWRYCVIDHTGKLIFQWQDEGLRSADLVYDDRGGVLLSATNWTEGRIASHTRHYLMSWDEEKGRLETLEEIPMTEENQDWYFTRFGEGELVTVNPKGIYVGKDGMEEELYQWKKHGINVGSIEEVRRSEDGRIQVIYTSNGTHWYISLKETEEKKEIMEVEIAVSPSMLQTYQSAVNEFNKSFPAYHISVKDDYDERQLLTKLIAGEGPVLIDSSLTGFESQVDLWMPLDNLFARLGMEEELVADAMRLGEIDGRLYGVVSNFWIETAVTRSMESGHWNYDLFLELAEKNHVKALSEYQAGDNGITLFSRLLTEGLEDNAYLDPGLGGLSFEREEFSRLLDMAEKYYEGQSALPEEEPLWPEGGALCNTVVISRPEDLEFYRTFYGEEVCYAGYPSREGAGHYLNALAPMTIRKTADAKEKAVALAFFKYLLSLDVQREASEDLNFNLSVRKDVLESQIQEIQGGLIIHKYGYPDIKIKEEPDIEKNRELFYGLLENSKPKKYFPGQLRDILYEELDAYLSGGIAREALIDHLSNRVGLYLNENMP